MRTEPPRIILAFGAFHSFEPRAAQWLRALASRLEGRADIITINEADPRHWRPECPPPDSSILVPLVFRQVRPKRNLRPLSAKLKDLIARKSFIREAGECLLNMFPQDLDERSALRMAALFHLYARRLFSRFRPGLIIIWNQFYPFHSVVRHSAEEENIPLIYMEYGPLPGSFVFDKEGQMGESLPARFPLDFNALPVSGEEVRAMSEHLERLKKSGQNRKAQPKISVKGLLRARLAPGRPVILYAGQNDCESGLVPYTAQAAAWHSPFFDSTLEALTALDRAAAENDWNLVYKPHPIVAIKKSENLESLRLLRALIVQEADINEIIDLSDLVVTILSQTAYVALIRGKATLMLGHNQLKGSGAIYQLEGGGAEQVKAAVSRALKSGFSETMRHNFITHCARLARRYLYSHEPEGASPYQGTPDTLTRIILDRMKHGPA